MYQVVTEASKSSTNFFSLRGNAVCVLALVCFRCVDALVDGYADGCDGGGDNH